MKEVNKEPFIHLFSCSTGYYLYDVNTDSILKVTPDTYQRLEKRENIEENEQIRKLKKYGYLKTSHVQISEHPVTKLLPSLYENRIGNLTLQVTQQCNLRCDYCVYSGKYYTRTHSNKRMSFEMAKKGLDFLLSHSSACEELRVGFYGGEPLLEFELIKRCVEYMETQTKDKAVHYQITTNGTLLKGEILTYLIEKKFEITISFDGPKEIHDRYRKFAGSDKGSYDTVMQNARYIKEHYHNFFISNVTFNTVISPEESYSCIGNYFKGEELFQDAVFTSGLVKDEGKKEKNTVSDRFSEEYQYEYFKLLMSKLGKIRKDNTSVLGREQVEFLKMLRGGKQQDEDIELPKKWHHGGPCIPGIRSLFVTVEGDLYPCEKVCENVELARMGNINSGIDIQKASQILNIEDITSGQCKDCWAYRYCDFCIRYAEKEKEELKTCLLRNCADMRKKIEHVFKDYCVLRELGYDFETDSLRKGTENGRK